MEILARINWVDVLILIIVLRTSYVSLKDGLSHELFPLFGSIVMVVASLGYYGRLGSFFSHSLFNMPSDMANFLAFVVLVVSSGLIFKLLKVAVDFIIRIEWNPFVEKTGGALCGILRSFVASSLILMILAMIPLPYLQRSIRERSLAGRHILMIGPYIFEKVSYVIPVLRENAAAADRKEMLNRLEADKTININPSSDTKPKKAEWEKVTEF